MPNGQLNDGTGQPAALLTTDEAARYLKMSKDWVYRAGAAGVLRRVRMGRYLRFRREDLDAFIASRTDGGGQ